MLLISIINITNLGLLDGIYIKYGGKNIENLSKKTLSSEFYFLLFQQITITIMFIALFTIFKLNLLYYLVIITIIPINVFTFYSYLYQSTGLFSKYSFLHLTRTIFNFIPMILLFIFFANNNVYFLIIVQLAMFYSIIIIMFLSNYRYLRYFKVKKMFNKSKIILMKVGIFILIGNFVSILIYSMDRWFIKLFFLNSEFAMYSFAVSILSMITLLMTSVSMTFYPYFAKNKKNFLWFNLLKKIVLIIGIIGIGSYFILKGIVEWYLPDYKRSLEIVIILFASLPLVSVINSIYINIYKAFKKERIYFYTVFLMLVVSVVTNGIALVLFHTMEAIAIATTVTFFVWYVFSSFYKKFLRIDLREYLLIAGYIMTFYMSYLVGRYFEGNMGMGYVVGSVVGMITYYVIILVMIHVYDRGFYGVMWKLGKEHLMTLLISKKHGKMQ